MFRHCSRWTKLLSRDTRRTRLFVRYCDIDTSLAVSHSTSAFWCSSRSRSSMALRRRRCVASHFSTSSSIVAARRSLDSSTARRVSYVDISLRCSRASARVVVRVLLHGDRSDASNVERNVLCIDVQAASRATNDWRQRACIVSMRYSIRGAFTAIVMARWCRAIQAATTTVAVPLAAVSRMAQHVRSAIAIRNRFVFLLLFQFVSDSIFWKKTIRSWSFEIYLGSGFYLVLVTHTLSQPLLYFIYDFLITRVCFRNLAFYKELNKRKLNYDFVCRSKKELIDCFNLCVCSFAITIRTYKLFFSPIVLCSWWCPSESHKFLCTSL